MEPKQDVICPFCGKDMPPESRYCLFCGKELAGQSDLKSFEEVVKQWSQAGILSSFPGKST